MLWWLAQNALVAALLAVVVAGVCRLGRFRPAVRHALWLIVLIKLVMPPIYAWPWSLSEFWDSPSSQLAEQAALTSQDAPNNPSTPTTEAQVDLAAGTPPDSDLPDNTPAPAAEELASAPPEAPALPQPVPPAPAAIAPVTAEFPTQPVDWPDLAGNVALWLWATGTLAMFVLEARRILRFRRLLRCARPAPRRLRRTVQLLSRQLGIKPPPALLVPGLRSPMIWAFGRPRLLWPAELPEDWESASRQSVIVHELAHVRRRDHWVRWLELAAVCVWWWHPVFWWVRRQLRLFADWACDAWVIWALPDSRRAYAEALIEVTTLSMKAAAPVPALGIGDARQAFQRRLTMIMSERVPRRAPSWGLAAIAVVGLATLPGWSLGQTPEIQRATEAQLELQRLRAELEKARAELAKAQADAAVYRDLKAVEERRSAQHAERAAQQAALAEKAEYQARLAAAHPDWGQRADHATAAGLLALAQAGAELKRPWGPEQATGAPDTPEPGDHQTAWASSTRDDRDEWLQLDYAQKVQAVAIIVYESHNPGAVTQITVSQPGNQHEFAWKVKDPTPVGNASGVSVFPVPAQVDFTVTRVRLEVASTKVQGWNEIDAVGILDTHGKTHWATKATASSYYGQEEPETASRDAHARYARSVTSTATGGTSARWASKPDPNVTAETNQRLEKLEKDMAEMRETLLEMRGMLRRDQGPRNSVPVKP